jgi:YVTN family beta-propeller protein
MKRALLALSLVVPAAGCSPDPPGELPGIERAVARGPRDFLRQAAVGPQGDGTYVVATTQIVSPAGETVRFRGRPTDLALRPDGNLLAVKSSFDLVLIDTKSGTVRQSLTLPETSRAYPDLGDGSASYCGLVWAADGKTIWTTDAHDALHAATLGEDGRLSWTRRVLFPGPVESADDEDGGEEGHALARSAPGGIALDPQKGMLYVALSRNNTVGLVEAASGERRGEIPVGMVPYTVHIVGRKAYVSNWGGRHARPGEVTGPSSGSAVVVDPDTGVVASGSVSVIDLDRGTVVSEVELGLHPSGLASDPGGRYVYVANANSDRVSVIDTRTDTLAGDIDVRPMRTLPPGSAPNAVALSSDGSRLYVALGGNNALAVVDTGSRVVLGFVPTGWYPSAVVTRPDGTILVASLKGLGSRGTELGIAPHIFPERDPQTDGYNSHDYVGTVSILEPPDRERLDQYTEQVAVNMRLPLMLDAMGRVASDPKQVPVPTRPGETSVFEHVLYIIKENRTYDQILGDVRKGNGEPAFCLFGEDVTPNHHAIAEEFVLFDNFYCNGVLSADGHQWTDEGFVTDYIEKSFGGFPRSYPYDGGDAMAYSPGGFIWDQVLKKGLTFRVYGEFVKAVIDPPGATWSDIYRDYVDGVRRVSIRATSELHTLRPYLSPRFVGFPGTVPDVYRAREFIEELQNFEREGDLPSFMIMLLPNDHTAGARQGFPTPRAMAADNDLALGRIVEAVSKSRFWPKTVIFVVEDDPQNGLDHVDGRRTVALVASPYTRRGFVDSNHYNQSSLLRTIELILGLPPMTQLDLSANPMVDCFTGEIDTTPYEARDNRVALDEMNRPAAELRGVARRDSEESQALPLDDVDLANEDVLNRILWRSVKGYDVPYPEVNRAGEAGADAWGFEATGETQAERERERRR